MTGAPLRERHTAQRKTCTEHAVLELARRIAEQELRLEALVVNDTVSSWDEI